MSSSLLIVQPDFARLFESVPGRYLVLSPALDIVAVSDAYLCATMTERQRIVGRSIFEVFPDDPNDHGADGVANLRSSLRRVLETAVPDTMAVQQYPIRRPDSEGGGFEQRFWSPSNSPVFGETGAIEYIIHCVEDVSEFVRLRQRSRDEHQINEELRTRAGAVEAEVYERAREIQAANQKLRDLQGELEARVQARTRDLQEANERLQSEVREREKTEEALRSSQAQLRHSQKLEAIGLLAGGIAHDFNNLLSVILGYSKIVLEDLEPGSPLAPDIEEIHRAGHQAANLTRQLLAFSRQQVLDPVLLDLNEVIDDMAKILSRVLGEDIELEVLTADGLGRVKADRGQIEQILMNLVVNSRDAMPTGGRLTIETDVVLLDGAHAEQQLGVAAGRYAMIAVSDTGTGIDKDAQPRVFEPFFTTKQLGKGTGLGLSTVFGIVRQSGGGIWLYSEPGTGTTIKIYLPVVPEACTDRTPLRPSLSVARGNETVLLVEDADPVRHLICAILRKVGYRVLDARHPDEALLICEQYPGTIDLLLTDVVMPKMNGRQLAQRIVEMRPTIRSLFVSGYTDDAILHHGVMQSGVPFLQKPIMPDPLTRKIRQILDAD